ncbi:MAG TPA: hypothetical protein VN253_05345 [Kofleriaceae bacterium]|nr:hypothetical protein [Kofleriaceae bacterium]
MRRLLPLTLLALTLLGGAAFADHRRYERRDERRDDRGPVVRDHREPRPVVRQDRRVVTRNRVYVNNGRYVFNGGVSRTYVRPVIRQRYYNVRVRPQIVVENYDPVPGYVWVTGNWQWNGYEWVWTSGYFAPDTRYRVWYDDGSWE